MSADQAVLWVPHPALMLERLAGLSVLERQLFILRRAGVRRVWITTPRPADQRLAALRWPEGLEIVWVSKEEDGAAPCQPPYLAVSGDHFIRRDALEALMAAPHERSTSYQEGRLGIVQFTLPGRDPGNKMDIRPMPPGASILLEAPLRRSRALRWILDQARKDSDGFMARHFDRNISLAVTRRLLDTPVRPTHMTVFSSLVGVAGGLLTLGGTHPYVAAGALLVWLHSVLDGCDGELARLRFQESRLGGILDFWGDNLVHLCLFLCLGIGRAQATGRGIYLALGISAAVSAAASAWLAAQHSLRKADAAKAGAPLFKGVADAAVGGPWGFLADFENSLAQRDFIYGLVALALLGWIDLFVWAAGIGSPLFLAILLRLRSRPG